MIKFFAEPGVAKTVVTPSTKWSARYAIVTVSNSELVCECIMSAHSFCYVLCNAPECLCFLIHLIRL